MKDGISLHSISITMVGGFWGRPLWRAASWGTQAAFHVWLAIIPPHLGRDFFYR